MPIRSAIETQVVLSYIFVLLFYIYCTLVVRHPDDGHGSARNMLVNNNNNNSNNNNNNIRWNIFIKYLCWVVI